MIVSEQRIAANRRNAARSTGPTTEAGKRQSRANALKHGLTAAVVVPSADEATLRERTVGVNETIRPQTSFQAWVCAGIAWITIRLDRLAALEPQVRAGVAWRAIEFWEEDQRLEADRIAQRLARDPSRTVGQLRRSVAGCDVLIERWALLAESAARQPWSDEQTTLAHDLLGTPPEFRTNAPGLAVDSAGCRLATEPTEAALAHAMLDDLNAHRARVVEADAIARALAEADRDDFHNRDLIRLQRYERALQNDLYRYHAMSQYESPHALMSPKFLAAVPTEFLDPPSPPNEPVPPAPGASNEPIPPAPVVSNEPNLVRPADRSKPLSVIPPDVLPEPIVPTHPPKRPDLARIARRDRKARRKRGQRQHSV